MTWKNSRHGPCECIQSERLLLLIAVGLGRRTFRGLTLQNKFYHSSCRVDKSNPEKEKKTRVTTEMDMKQVNLTIKSDNIIYELTLKCLAMVI